MADKKAVTLEHLKITKNYIDIKDAENIKSAEYVDNIIKFYTTEDKSGEAVAEVVLPEEMFLDSSKTELVNDFTWDITKYPKSTDPELDGKPVLVLAVKSVRTVRYSFISFDSVIAKLIGEETESASVSVAEDVISLNVKVSELSGNRIVIKDDGLYVGTVDNTPSWTVSTDDEVREMFSVSGGGIMLSSMNIGDTVKIMRNDVPENFTIVHKGLPSDMYDESCDGVWLLSDDNVAQMAHYGTSQTSSNNNYVVSSIRSYLEGAYYDSLDDLIKPYIKTVKIPYKQGRGKDAYPVLTGASGLESKVFLLSACELGNEPTAYNYVPKDGTTLIYFSGDYIRENNYQVFWTRTPSTNSNTHYYRASGWLPDMSIDANIQSYTKYGVRPALVLDPSVFVNANGLLIA